MKTASFAFARIRAIAEGRQLLTWATLYYGFSWFVLPVQHEFGRDRTEVMGAFTLALAMSGLGAYVVGSAIDRGMILPALFGAREVGRISGAIGHVSLFARAAAALGAAALLVWLHSYRGVGLALATVAAAAALSLGAARPVASTRAA